MVNLYRGFESLTLRYVLCLYSSSLKDLSFYVGQCDNLDRRMSKHYDGLSKYTAIKRPLRLKDFKVYHSRT